MNKNSPVHDIKNYSIQKTLHAGIHNRFDIEVIDSRTGEIRQQAQAFNIVCDNLWIKLFTPTTYFNAIHYGTGSGTPSSRDSSLFSYLGYGSCSNVTNSTNYTTGIHTRTKSIQLSESVAVGSTITEVGIAYGADSGTLCTHAMLQDMDGNPTSIEKTNTDIVNIYATIYVHFNPYGYAGNSIFFAQSSYNCEYIFEWLAGSCSDSDEGPPTQAYFTPYGSSSISGSSGSQVPAGASSVSLTWNFDATAKTLTFTGSTLPATSITSGGIRTIMLRSRYYGLSGSDYITIFLKVGGDWWPYSEITGEVVGTGDGTTSEFSLAFPFAHDAKIYIDGIETTDVEVFHAPNSSSNWGYYMEVLNAALSTAETHVVKCATYLTNLSATNVVLYNPMYSVGISVLSGNSLSVYASNDLINWTDELPYTTGSYSSRTVTIPEGYQHYKYWKYSGQISSITPASNFTGKVVRFANPPEVNAHITADYKTECINKDENTVLDFSFIIKLEEYVEEAASES